VIAILVNRSSGTAKSHPDLDRELRDLFAAADPGADVTVMEARGSIAETAKRLRESADVVVAAGGDGTVSGTAAGLAGSKTPLGILPLGTLNHFAKDLGIPMDLARAVGVIAARRVVAVDAGELNGRVFINNASIGLYPDIVEERVALQRSGHRKWPAMVMATLRVMRRYPGLTARIDSDGVHETRRTPFVLVGNNEYAIDGIRLGGRPRLDRGRLFAYLAPRLHARDLPLLLGQALLGRAASSGALEIVAATELSIDTAFSRRVHVGLDGEVATMRAPLRFVLRPRALNVIVP
jgi:diacylglycerol kinase family enzyme